MELIFFTQEGCRPCKALEPQLDSFMAERSDVGYHKYNAADDLDSFVFHEVRSTPGIVIVEDGETIAKYLGANATMVNLKKFFNALLV